MPETDKSNTKLHRLKVWFLKHIENFRDGVLSFLQDLDLSSFKSLKRLLFLFTVILVGSGVGVAIAGIKVPNLEKYIFDNVLFLVTYTLILVALSVFTFVTVFKYKYRISFWETLVFFLVFSFYFSWYNTENSSLTQFQFEYWDLNIFTIIIIILSVLFVGISLNASWPKKKRENNNTFLEDNPLSHDEQKEDTSYNHLISKIAPALFTDAYKSSFSIGVIGPWGTGKSSFLKAVKKAVCETSFEDVNKYYGTNLKKKPDTIFIEFSPFLNHNEEQVIHEFFTQLSNKLSKRSGRLSNLITTYSEKLAKLSRHNSWFSLFNLAKNSRENKSAKELYDEIKSCIAELNLKIIVTVDDLDRLNAKEILQVLKLIRNTSNFPNTVFLVAMDKEYVIRTLGGENKYAYRDYIEKFFQVEMVIKQPNYIDVVKRVVREAKQTKNINESNLKKFENVLTASSSESLKIIFGNYRSAIKLMNQAIIDDKSIPNLFTEINIEDYLKFTYLEMNFPKFYGKLIKEPRIYLDSESSEKFKLKEKRKSDKEMTSSDVAKELTEREINSILEQHNFEQKYNFDDFDFGEELDNPIDELKFSKEESLIIKHIFIEVFEYGKPEGGSLRLISNFYKLIRLKIDENEISETVFNMIIKEVVKELDKEGYDKIIEEANLDFKSNSLVKKLNNYKSVNREEYLGLFSLILVTYGKLYSKDENYINRNLRNLVDAFFDIPGFNKNSEIDKEYLGLKNSIEKYWINNEEVSNAIKLQFVLNIKENEFLVIREHFSKIWKQEEYENICLDLFQKYLSEYKKKEWSVKDFTFLAFVRKLKENLQENKFSKVQLLIKKHFESSPIENFCLQLLKDGYYNVKHKYQISEDVLLVYESFLEFYELLIDKLLIAKEINSELVKFMHVLEFYSISKEKFENGIAIIEVFGDKIKENDNKGFKEVSQIIIEVLNQETADELERIDIPREILMDSQMNARLIKSINFKASYLFIDIYVHNEAVIKDFENYMNELLSELKTKVNFEIDKLSDGFVFSNEKEEKILEVISVRTTNRK